MPLVTVDDVRARIVTTLSDAALQDLIADEEAEMERRYGVTGDGTTAVAETVTAYGGMLFLSRPIASITSVAEYSDLSGTATTLAASSYLAWPGEGRITRLPEGTDWGVRMVVTYVPADERPRRRQVLLELIRLSAARMAMKSESDIGSSYTAPDWEAERAKLYARLSYTSV